MEWCGRKPPRGPRTSPKLTPYATVSLLLKKAIEAFTFDSLTIRSDELDQLRTIGMNNRLRFVTEIKYEILLPEYSVEACSRMESDEDKRLDDEVFTQAIHDLFVALTHMGR